MILRMVSGLSKKTKWRCKKVGCLLFGFNNNLSKNNLLWYLYNVMAKKIARGIEQEIEKARGDGRWEDIPKLLKDLDFNKSSLSGY